MKNVALYLISALALCFCQVHAQVQLDVEGDANVDGDLIVNDNVGIGVALPSAKLDVVGTSELNGNVHIFDNVEIYNANSSINFRSESAGNHAIRWYGGDGLFDGMLIYQSDGDYVKFTNNGLLPGLTFDFSNNHVGIGTETPETKLHIFNGAGSSTAPPSSVVDFYLEDDSQCYIELNGTSWSGLTFNDDNASVRAGYLFDHSSDRLMFRTGGANNRMSIAEDGLVGINDVAPSAMLHIKQLGDGEEGLAIENDSDTDTWSFEIGGNDLFLYFNGTNVGQWDDANGNYVATSDQRLKKNITTLGHGYLDKLMKLSPKKYYYNHDQEMTKKTFGYLAQDVLKIFPDAVREGDNEDGYLGLDYQDMGVIAVKAIQELNEKVDRLEAELEEKNKQLELMESLEARVAKLESVLQK